MYGTSTFTQDGIRKTNFQADQHFIALLKSQWQEYIDNIKPYPGSFKGRGIVICAGGVPYFTCAWVNINMLRINGCTLPIEVWYTGTELSDELIDELAKLGVKCRNSKDYTKSNVQSYALKPFAILNSEFKEVLFLDADNNSVTDPAYLFDNEQYRNTGAVFWPDFWITDKANPIWEIVNAEEGFNSNEQESGQILVNKEKCWRELNLCMYFNLNRDHYYKMLLGDKDTFRFAWIALRSSYYMMPSPVGFSGFNESANGFLGLTMVQHDFTGNILFLHRNWLKWDITLDNEQVWTEIKRFKPGATNKRFLHKNFANDKFQFDFWDISGDVESVSFRDSFGDYELICLDILKNLRNADFYARFLVYTYFVYYRPGYANGHTGNLFTASSRATTIII